MSIPAKDQIEAEPIVLVTPDWSPPANIKSILTTRFGGWSQHGYQGFNLATHVGDDLRNVLRNRAILRKSLPSEPIWLNQVHGVDVWESGLEGSLIPTADAAVTNKPNEVLVIMTADCLPILFCDASGKTIAAAHAGWRGLCQGVIEKSIDGMIRSAKPKSAQLYISNLQVWLGPCIGVDHFEVGIDVFDAFKRTPQFTGIAIEEYFIKSDVEGKYFANLHELARAHLKKLGVKEIFGQPKCTFDDASNFFSFRRHNSTGRFASLIWIENQS